MKIIPPSTLKNKSAFINGSCILKPEPINIETINYKHSRVSDDDFYWKTNRIDKRIARLHNEKKTFSKKYVDALSHDKKYMTVTRRDFYNIK